MKALSPAKVKEVRLDEETGTATVIVHDYQLSLAIGKEGQNARLAARLTGWRIDIKSETQLAEEEAGYSGEEWAEGEWVTDEATGEMVWQPAEGGEALSAEAWSAGADAPDTEGESAGEPDQEDTAGEADQSTTAAEASPAAGTVEVAAGVAEAVDTEAEAEAEAEAETAEESTEEAPA